MSLVSESLNVNWSRNAEFGQSLPHSVTKIGKYLVVFVQIIGKNLGQGRLEVGDDSCSPDPHAHEGRTPHHTHFLVCPRQTIHEQFGEQEEYPPEARPDDVLLRLELHVLSKPVRARILPAEPLPAIGLLYAYPIFPDLPLASPAVPLLPVSPVRPVRPVRDAPRTVSVPVRPVAACWTAGTGTRS
jgi:hypothetical protein